MKLFPYYLLLTILLWSSGLAIEYTRNLIVSSHEDELHLIMEYKNTGPLRLYTEDGILIGEYGDTRRIITTIDKLPRNVIDAILLQEDKEFWQHSGINILSLGRAASELISEGRIISGGSTITMQLVKNHILSRDKSFTRKIKEIALSIAIEEKYTKSELLEAYINTVFFGERSYGLGAAAQHYFNKKARDLTTSEAIRLAITIRAPSVLHPGVKSDYIEKAFYRLADKMLSENIISEKEREEINIPGIHTSNESEDLNTPSLSYAKDWAYSKLLDKYGEEINESGWDVTLTINSQYQDASEKALQWGLTTYERRSNSFFSVPKEKERIGNLIPVKIIGLNSYSISTESLIDKERINIFEEGLRWTLRDLLDEDELLKAGVLNDIYSIGDTLYVHKDPYRGWMIGSTPKTNASATIIEHDTGAVKSLVGGFDYKQSQFNRATESKRQIASTVKPFLYMLALEKGYDRNTKIDLGLDNIEEDWSFLSKGVDKEISLEDALIFSNNQAAVSILNNIGVGLFKDYLSRVGIETDESNDSLALALGTAESNTLTMANAFGIIANGGRTISPKIIKSIKGRLEGHPAPELENCSFCLNKKSGRIEFSRANELRELLKDVVNYGTAKRAKLIDGSDVGGKTGTSNNAHDVWFSGFNKSLTASVWVGADQAFDLGETEYGSSIALPIWVEMMEQVQKIIDRNSSTKDELIKLLN